MQIITSRDNPNVKRIAKLTKRDQAKKENLIYLEGTRLCEEALASGQAAVEVIVTEDKTGWAEEHTPGVEPLVLSSDVFRKISQTVNPQGVALVIREPELTAEIPHGKDGKDIYVVLENTQDPGNLGTIIRTADAFGLTAVIVSPTTCDPFNDKVIRATMGSVWHIPVIRKTMDECFRFFDNAGIDTLAMHLNGSELDSGILRLPCAFFIGNEGDGLTDETAARCSKLIRIPMRGKAESLNAAVAASVIGYELSKLL
ncbi:MAG: RNA methyltransferase [Clostridiales bacterium]|nr:RNA methyltransferase [Clostridiales bacterium]